MDNDLNEKPITDLKNTICKRVYSEGYYYIVGFDEWMSEVDTMEFKKIVENDKLKTIENDYKFKT